MASLTLRIRRNELEDDQLRGFNCRGYNCQVSQAEPCIFLNIDPRLGGGEVLGLSPPLETYSHGEHSIGCAARRTNLLEPAPFRD